jgi:hypothetical protein
MARTKREEERLAEEMFLEACLEEMDDGNAVTVVVADERTARGMRAAIAKRSRGSIRVEVGDPEAAAGLASGRQRKGGRKP